MLQPQRHREILRVLSQEGSISVGVVAERFGASPATIRRDLNRLERNGMLFRVHGGAVLAPQSEASFDHVTAEDHAGKESVAQTAANLVYDKEVVLLDIGTTTHRLAAHLRGRSVTVITSSLAVYEELRADTTVRLMLLGGMLRRHYRSMVGFLTEDALRQVHADRLFLATSGVRPDGSVMDDTAVEVPLKRAMLRATDQVVLIADKGKFPGHGMARVCGPDKVQVLVTNDGACPDSLVAMRESGVEVIQA